MKQYKITQCGKKEPTIIRNIVEYPDLNKLVKTYYGSVYINVGETSCGTITRAAVGYHPDDVRDPAATVAYMDEQGDIVAYLYPNSSAAHSVPVTTDEGTVIGYGLGLPFITYTSVKAVTTERSDLQAMYSLDNTLLGFNHSTNGA